MAAIAQFEITNGTDPVLHVAVDFPGSWMVRENDANGRPLGLIGLVYGGAGFSASTLTFPGAQATKEFAPPQFSDAARWLYQVVNSKA